MRELYYPFEEGMKAPGPEVYQHEMPGGQYTNLRQQARNLGLDDRWPEVCEAYAEVNQLFGDIVKVTPSSKVVGDMALFLVTNNLTADDVLNADDAAQLSPQRRRDDAGAARRARGRLAEGVPEDRAQVGARGADQGPARRDDADGRFCRRGARRFRRKTRREPSEDDVLSYLLYPQVYLDFQKHVAAVRRHVDDSDGAISSTACSPAKRSSIEIERGKTLIVRYLTTGEVREDGTRTVFFELNGQPREVNVADRSVAATLKRHPKADPDNPDHIAAPMPGKVSAVAVRRGPDGQGRRAAAVDRSDEDGDGGLQSARRAGRRDLCGTRDGRRIERSAVEAGELRCQMGV